MDESPLRSELLPRLARTRQWTESLLFEKDHLESRLCPAIEAAWLARVGVRQCELFELSLEASMFKWKAEMAQAMINRQEAVDTGLIEGQAAERFKIKRLKLASLAHEAGQALACVNSDPIPKPEADAIKSAYRAIVKRIHPDLKPDASEDELRLFRMASLAYKQLDQETLMTVEAVVCGSAEDPGRLSDEEIASEISRLGDLILALDSSIAAIMNAYPYNRKKILEDPAALQREIADLEKQIELKRAEAAFYENRLLALTGGKNVGKTH